MVPNAKFWTDYFRQAIRELQGFRAGALEKVVPAFEGIAEDAERAAEAEYERLESMLSYDDQIDMSDVADMAKDHGITVYETMSGVRQGVLNVLAVGLYHLFEQQQLFFLRRGLLSRAEDVPALVKVAEFEKRLAECGVECRSFSCAGKLHELKTAANAIKHGPGLVKDARRKQRQTRPARGRRRGLNEQTAHALRYPVSRATMRHGRPHSMNDSTPPLEPISARVMRQVVSGTLDEARLLPAPDKRERDVRKSLAKLAEHKSWYVFVAGQAYAMVVHSKAPGQRNAEIFTTYDGRVPAR